MSETGKYQSEAYIDAYLLGQLSPEERKAFEEAMNQHETLRQQVDEHRLLIEGIEQAGNERVKARFQQLERSKPYRRNIRFRMAVAASLIVLVVAGIFLFNALNRTDAQQIFASHFDPYPVIEQGTIRGTNDGSELVQGLQAYEQGQYATAIDLLVPFQSANPHQTIVQFYLGLSYLANNQAERAVVVLRPLADNSDFALSEQATWYLGLAYLKTGATAKSTAIFDQLQKESNDPAIQNMANRILSDLE